MDMHRIDISTLLKAGAVSLLAVLAAPLAPASAHAIDCSELPAALSSDPLRADGFRVLDTNKLYRVQERPWSHIPTGAKVTLRAPAGVTSADLQRSAICAASSDSPLSVPGAKLRVTRSGDVYELSVTAPTRSAALEIQRRASAL